MWYSHGSRWVFQVETELERIEPAGLLKLLFQTPGLENGAAVSVHTETRIPNTIKGGISAGALFLTLIASLSASQALFVQDNFWVMNYHSLMIVRAKSSTCESKCTPACVLMGYISRFEVNQYQR